MDNLSNDTLIKFNSDTLDGVRQAYGFDNPARMEEAVNILEEWIKKQNHYTQKSYERAYLERTIIICKGSIERAKTQIDSTCTFRTLLPKYFVDFYPKDDLTPLLHKGCFVLLPKLTNDHFRVWLLKLKTIDIKPGDYIKFVRLLVTLAEYVKRHDYFNGIIILYDFRNLNLLELATKLIISELRESLAIILKGFGMRIKQIHIIHESPVTEFVIKFAKLLVSDKIISKIKFHREVEHIYEYIEPSILPVEYRGTERSLDALTDEWINVLSSDNHMDYLKNMNQAKTDEKNRVEETFNSMYMGTPGSFRHLIVD